MDAPGRAYREIYPDSIDVLSQPCYRSKDSRVPLVDLTNWKDEERSVQNHKIEDDNKYTYERQNNQEIAQEIVNDSRLSEQQDYIKSGMLSSITLL